MDGWICDKHNKLQLVLPIGTNIPIFQSLVESQNLSKVGQQLPHAGEHVTRWIVPHAAGGSIGNCRHARIRPF